MTNYRRKRRPQKDEGQKFTLNEDIKAEQIRLINDAGEFLGIMPLTEALKLAEEKEEDLIEINPKAEPPVVKITDYNKFKYQQSKAEAGLKKKVEKIKTVRVSVRIGPHDLQVQAKKVEEFLGKNYKVKLQVQMKRREKAFPEVAEEVIHQFVNLIQSPFSYLQEPKQISDSYFATIQPKA